MPLYEPQSFALATPALSTVNEDTFELSGPTFSFSRMSDDGMIEEQEILRCEFEDVAGEDNISEVTEKIFLSPLPPAPTPVKNLSKKEKECCNNRSPHHPRLSEQFSQGHEALDAAKAAVYAEQARVKELTDALKAAETDVKDCKAVINVLTTQMREVDDEVRHLKNELFEKRKVAEEAAIELGEAKKIVEREERRRIRLDCRMKEQLKEMELAKKSFAEAKTENERKSKELEEKQKQIEDLQKKLDDENNLNLKEKVVQLEFVVRENEFKLEEKEQAIETSKKNIQTLKDACAVLEDQLKRVEVVVEEKEQLVQKALNEKVALIEGIKAKDEIIRAVKADLNEAKSQQHMLKNQLESLEAKSNQEKRERDDMYSKLMSSYNDTKTSYEEQLQNQATEFKNSIEEIKNFYEEKLHDQSVLAQQVVALKEEKEILECVNQELKTKEVRYGLEISRYLENIVNIKEQNINLKTDLHEATQKVEFYRQRATELIEEKNNAEMDQMQKEAELQSKINQQAKLVQFFQSQAQLLSAKKKKFRFFGKEKPIELPEPPTDLTPQTKKKYFPDISFVPRTPTSAAKTPSAKILPEPKIKAKLQFDDEEEEISSTEDQPLDEGSSSFATSASDSSTDYIKTQP